MKVAGFTIIRNAIKFDYPVIEAITSVLPVCDVFYVGVGNSEDDTKTLIENIDSNKIRIIESTWDDTLREGGRLLSVETNKVFDQIPEMYDWCFYIQSDECVHEQDLPAIKKALEDHAGNIEVEGLLFSYKHFYGQYQWVGAGRRWYRQEIRIIRNNKNIRSYKDAQGFRTSDNKKLKVIQIPASIYHYGWVKPPKAQQAKQKHFHKMWHNDETVKKKTGEAETFDYSDIDLLEAFRGTHPGVMKDRISRADWQFHYDPKRMKAGLKFRILHFIEKITGWRVGENRNFQKLKIKN